MIDAPDNDIHSPDEESLEVIDPHKEGTMSTSSRSQTQTQSKKRKEARGMIHQPRRIQIDAKYGASLAVLSLLYLHPLIV